MTMRATWMVFGAGIVAVFAWTMSRELTRRREKAALEDEVSRWESEGGNAPAVEMQPQVFANSLS